MRPLHSTPSDGRSTSGDSPSRTRTPDPIFLSVIDPSPPRPQSSSPTKRDIRRLGLSAGGATPTGPRTVGAGRSAASLIALFENGHNSTSLAAATEVGSPSAPGERKSAPLLLQGVGSPPPNAFNSYRLGDRRTYLSPVALEAGLPGNSPPSYVFRSRVGTSLPRRSVFDLPQFLPRARSTSPGTANVLVSPSTETSRLSRPILRLFPLLSFGSAGNLGKVENDNAPPDDDGDSSPLEELTPQPMLEGQLPPLPQSFSEDVVLGYPIAETSTASPSRWRRPRRPSLSNLASAVLGGGSRKPAIAGKIGHGRTWTEAAAPLVRRGAVVVRSLSQTGGRGRRRANSAPTAPPSEANDELGEARSMRDEVEPGFSWRPEELMVLAPDQSSSYVDDNGSVDGNDGLNSIGAAPLTRHTLFDTSPSSSDRPEHGHTSSNFAPILTASVSRTSTYSGDSAFTALDTHLASPASIRSFDPALERDLERSSTISTIARTDISTISDRGYDDDGDDEQLYARQDLHPAPGPPVQSEPSSSSTSSEVPPCPPSVPPTRTTTLTDVRSTETLSAASSSRYRRLSNDFSAAVRPTPTHSDILPAISSVSALGSQLLVTTEPGILTVRIARRHQNAAES